MEHVLNPQPGVRYFECVPHTYIDYLLNCTVDALPERVLAASFKYVRSRRARDEMSFRAAFFNEEQHGLYSHISNTARFLALERFLEPELMDHVKQIQKRGSFMPRYNDDNFVHLHVATTNYADLSSHKTKNLNLYNDERVENLIWRQWSKRHVKQVKTPARELISERNGLYSQFHMAKFLLAGNKHEAYIILTLPTQHEVCYGPMVSGEEGTKFDINERVTYACEGEDYMSLEMTRIENKLGGVGIKRTDSFSDDASYSTSLESDFGCSLASSMSSVSACGKTGMKKSCMKTRSKQLTSMTTHAEAKDLILSYHFDASRYCYASGKARRLDHLQVMFETEVKQAKKVEFLTEEERERALEDLERSEQSFVYKIKELQKNWSETIERYEEQHKQIDYWAQMQVYTQDLIEEQRAELESRFKASREELAEVCERYKRNHRDVKLKMNRLKGSKRMICRLKNPIMIKHGHFVENLEQKRAAWAADYKRKRPRYSERRGFWEAICLVPEY